MMSRRVLLLVLVFTANAAAALPSTEGAVRALLRRVDGETTADQWRRLGPGADKTLAEVATDRTAMYGFRARAIAGLGAVATDLARRTLEPMFEDPSLDPDLLAAVALAYARAFARPLPMEVTRRVTPLLDHEDWLVRRTVAQALGEWSSLAAVKALQARRLREEHAQVQAALDVALRAPSP